MLIYVMWLDSCYYKRMSHKKFPQTSGSKKKGNLHSISWKDLINIFLGDERGFYFSCGISLLNNCKKCPCYKSAEERDTFCVDMFFPVWDWALSWYSGILQPSKNTSLCSLLLYTWTVGVNVLDWHPVFALRWASDLSMASPTLPTINPSSYFKLNHSSAIKLVSHWNTHMTTHTSVDICYILVNSGKERQFSTRQSLHLDFIESLELVRIFGRRQHETEIVTGSDQSDSDL